MECGDPSVTKKGGALVHSEPREGISDLSVYQQIPEIKNLFVLQAFLMT